MSMHSSRQTANLAGRARDAKAGYGSRQRQRSDALEQVAGHRSETSQMVRDVLGQTGAPLEAATRASMEARFGHDFSRVRVHTDEFAGQSARAVGAHAYTAGSHIVFAPNRYAPDSGTGETLLAHELAHAVQQGSASATGGGLAALSPSEDRSLEAEANRAAKSAGPRVGKVPVRRRLASPALQREEAPGAVAYDIQLTYPPNQTEQYRALLPPDALQVLRLFAGRVESHFEGVSAEGHRYMVQLHKEQRIAKSGVSRF